MSQGRLNKLVLISIEYDYLKILIINTLLMILSKKCKKDKIQMITKV